MTRKDAESRREALPATRLIHLAVLIAACSSCVATPSASPRSDTPPPDRSAAPQIGATSSPSPAPPVEIVISGEALPTWLGPDTFSYAAAVTFQAGERLLVEGIYGNFALVRSAGAPAEAGFAPLRLLPALDRADLPQLPASEIPPSDELVVDPGRVMPSTTPLQFDSAWQLQVPVDGWVYVDAQFAEGSTIEGLAFLAHHPLLAPEPIQQHRLEVVFRPSGTLALEATYGIRAGEGELRTTPLAAAPESGHVLLRLELREGAVWGLEMLDGDNPAAPLAQATRADLGNHAFRPSLSTMFLGFRCEADLGTLGDHGLSSFRAWAVSGSTEAARIAPSWLVDTLGEPVAEPSAAITPSNARSLMPLVTWGDGEILQVEYSPDGRLLLLATTLGGIHLFETDTYVEIQRIETGTSLSNDVFWDCYYCGSAAISPDHRTVAVAGADGTLGFWRTQDGSSVRQLQAVDAPSVRDRGSSLGFGLGFSENGEIIWFTENGMLRGLYRVTDGSSVSFTVVGRGGVFSSDLMTLAASDAWGRPVLYRTSNWTDWEPLPISLAVTPPRAITPDGDLVATAGFTGNAQVWRVQDGAPAVLFGSMLPELPHGLSFSGAGAAFSADGETVAITRSYGYYRNFEWFPREARTEVWSTETRSLIGEVSYAIYSAGGYVALHPAGNALAYLSAPGVVEIISLPEGDVIGSASIGATCGGDFVVSPDGQLLATYSGNFILLCGTSDGGIVRRIRVPTAEVMDVAFSPDGSMLASSGFAPSYLEASRAAYDPNVYLWDVEDGSLLRTFSAHQGNVVAVAFSGDGTLLAAGGGLRPEMHCAERVSDPRIVVWRLADGQRLWTLDGVLGGTGHLAFSASGNRLAVTSRACFRGGSLPNGLWLYELSENLRINQLIGESRIGPLPEPIFGADDAILAAALGSESFLWLDSAAATQTEDVVLVEGALSPSGDLVATPLRGYVWGIALRSLGGSTIAERSGTLFPARLIFSPDGSRIYEAPETPGLLTVWGVPWEP